jgi:hypothetical protein
MICIAWSGLPFNLGPDLNLRALNASAPRRIQQGIALWNLNGHTYTPEASPIKPNCSSSTKETRELPVGGF